MESLEMKENKKEYFLLLTQVGIIVLLDICLTLVFSYFTMILMGIYSSDPEKWMAQLANLKLGKITAYIKQGKRVITTLGYHKSGYRILNYFSMKLLIPVTIFLLLLLITSFIFFREIQKLKIENERLQQRLDINIKELEMERKRSQKFCNQIDIYEGNLYHQFKTPLSSLMILCKEKDQLSIISRLSRMTTILLQEKKITSNKVRFEYKEIYLDEIIWDAVEDLSTLMNQAEGMLQIHIQNDFDWMVYGDEFWLQEAIKAILDNSIGNATGENGIHVFLYKELQKYVIRIETVADRLSEEQMMHLFERYYTNRVGHFGIGLHMSYEIIRNHNGNIRVYQKQDIGNNVVIFRIELPLLESAKKYL